MFLINGYVQFFQIFGFRTWWDQTRRDLYVDFFWRRTWNTWHVLAQCHLTPLILTLGNTWSTLVITLLGPWMSGQIFWVKMAVFSKKHGFSHWVILGKKLEYLGMGEGKHYSFSEAKWGGGARTLGTEMPRNFCWWPLPCGESKKNPAGHTSFYIEPILTTSFH